MHIRTVTSIPIMASSHPHMHIRIVTSVHRRASSHHHMHIRTVTSIPIMASSHHHMHIRSVTCVQKQQVHKAIPLQAWKCSDISMSLRLPEFKTSGNEGGKIVSPTHRPPLEPESSPEPQSGQKDYVNERSSDNIGTRNRELPTCSAVSQPTAPPRKLGNITYS
jgi:hypothetical protein